MGMGIHLCNRDRGRMLLARPCREAMTSLHVRTQVSPTPRLPCCLAVYTALTGEQYITIAIIPPSIGTTVPRNTSMALMVLMTAAAEAAMLLMSDGRQGCEAHQSNCKLRAYCFHAW